MELSLKFSASRAKKTQPQEQPRTTAKSASPEEIMKKLTRQAKSRQRQEIQKWMRAMDVAEHPQMPRLTQLVDVYNSILLDAHLSAQIQSRKIRLTGQPFTIVDKNGNEKPELTAMLNKDWFFRAMDIVLDSIFSGYGICELGMPESNGEVASVYAIPREHIHPVTGDIFINVNDTKGMVWKGTEYEKRLFEVGTPGDIGILSKAAPLVIYKRNVMGAWSEFAEVFGMPLRIGKVGSRSDEDRERMESFLKNMGSAPYAVIDIDDKIEFAEQTRTDAFKVYDNLIQRCNGELSKLIIGQTMTADNGSSRSQGEVHERLAEAYGAADSRLFEFVASSQIIPRLRQFYRYPFAEGDVFKFTSRQRITDIDVNQDTMLLNAFEFTDFAYFEQKYGVKITGRRNDSGGK